LLRCAIYRNSQLFQTVFAGKFNSGRSLRRKSLVSSKPQQIQAAATVG